jgi:hypothetical protein
MSVESYEIPTPSMIHELTWPLPQLPPTQNRSSFAVERTPLNHIPEASAHPNGQPQGRPPQGQGPGFQPYQMHQFPPPPPGQTPPEITSPLSPLGAGGLNPQSPPPPAKQGQQQRISSNPMSPPGNNDFGPYPSGGGMPRSQTMGFQGQGQGQGQGQNQGRGSPGERGNVGVPESHPYRGLVDQQNRGEQSQMSRSGSMPMNQGAGRPTGMTNGTSSPMRGSGSGSGSPLAGQSPHGSQNHIRQAPVNQLQPIQSNTPPIHSNNSPSNMPTPQMVQQPPTPSSQAIAHGLQNNQPTWQREFNNIVDLIGAQPNKHYVASPPELEMILARTSAGALPK